MTDEVRVERMQRRTVNWGPFSGFPLTIAKHGVTWGSTLSMICSWSVNQSVFWAILHGLLSWIYVIYYVLAY